ncbi:MAG TPA: glycosyltransferase, partial [Anaerolineales bacterium]|nr:glycosyltransferase [Anaerolineales bacterium]
MSAQKTISKSRWLFIHPFQLRFQRGIEVYLWNLASALTEENVDIHILTWAGDLDVPDYAKNSTFNLHIVPSVRYYQPYFAIPFYVTRLVMGNCGHVFVHFAGYGEGLALHIAQLFRKLSFSVVFHFPPSLVPHRYREFEKWGFHRDAVNLIAVSQSTADEVEQWAGRPCAFIEHGVDTERFSPDIILRQQIRNQLGI